MDAIQADGDIDEGARIEAVIPGDAGVVRFSVGIGVLSGDKLKGHHLLIGKECCKKTLSREPSA